MSEIDGKEQELFVRNMIRQLMKEQLNELNPDQKETNNSYVFLENRTLDMAILYMLMKEERWAYGEMNKEVDSRSEMKNVEKLDQVMADNKKEFEEIITLLKEKL